MKYIIVICVHGMPEDADGSKNQFGPYTSHHGAVKAFRRKGWHEADKGEYEPLSPPRGDRSFGTIEPLKRGKTKFRMWR